MKDDKESEDDAAPAPDASELEYRGKTDGEVLAWVAGFASVHGLPRWAHKRLFAISERLDKQDMKDRLPGPPDGMRGHIVTARMGTCKRY